MDYLVIKLFFMLVVFDLFKSFICKFFYKGFHVVECEPNEGKYANIKCPACNKKVGHYSFDEMNGKNVLTFHTQKYCSDCGIKLDWRKIDLGKYVING